MDTDLVIRIDNQQPLLAEDLANLLIAIGRDYRRLSGQELSVRQVKQGSVIVFLSEAFALMAPFGAQVGDLSKGAGALIDLYRRVAGLLQSASEGRGSELFNNKRKIGVKSAEKIIETVLKCDGEISLSIPFGADHPLEVKYTSSDALRIKERAIKQSRKQERTHHTFDADRFLRSTGVFEIGPDEEHQAVQIVSVLFDTGLRRLLPEVVASLQRQGRNSLAEMVARHAGIDTEVSNAESETASIENKPALRLEQDKTNELTRRTDKDV